MKYSDLALASADEDASMEGAIVGRWRMVLHPLTSRLRVEPQEIKLCVKNRPGSWSKHLLCMSCLSKRDRWRDECSTLMFNIGRWFSGSESEWLEDGVSSAFSLATFQMRPSSVWNVGGSDSYGTPRLDKMCLALMCEWIKDKQDHDKWTSETTGTIPRYRRIA